MRVIALSIFITCSLRIAHSRAKFPDDITFPEEVSDEMENDPCEGLTYCTIKPKDYPQEKFNEIFKNHTVLHRPSPLMEVPNRIGEDENDDQCKSEVTYAPLYKVRDSRKEAWRTVIQVPKKNFIQKVRMETCVNENSKCFTVFPGRNLYKAGCLQKHMSWQVLVYNAKKNKTELIKATIPSCCSCYYSESG